MSPNEVVVAGSSEFVDALLPLVSELFGGAPRVADSPLLASALCQGGARLLVYEHRGPEWLVLCSALGELAGPDLVAVAALPPEQAADVARISAAASAVVAWRGDPRPVLDAASRVLAAREGSPSSASARVAPAARTAPPAAAPRPAATPQAARPAVTPSGPRPAVAVAVPRPALTPSAPRPAVTPTAPRSAATPATVRPASMPAPARPAPPPSPASGALAAAVPFRASVTPGAPPPAPGDAGESFDGLFDETVAADLTPAPIAAAATPVGGMPPPSATWPANVLTGDDGLSVVRAALSGLWPEARLRPVTEAVVASLSTAEKAAALGQNLPFDAAPVRRAVGLRWQVAAALATLPPVGSPVDQHAVQGILLGIDEVLAALKEQGDDAGPESLRAVEAVRHALVKEAIDLTEALQGVASAEVVEEITTSRKTRRTPAVAATRMLTPPRPAPGERRSVPWGLVLLLVIAVAGAVAYHGYRYVRRPTPAEPTVPGAPAGSIGSATVHGKVVVMPPGASQDPAQLARFKALEGAKGNEVQEVMPGTFVVRPGAPSGTGGNLKTPSTGQGAGP